MIVIPFTKKVGKSKISCHQEIIDCVYILGMTERISNADFLIISCMVDKIYHSDDEFTITMDVYTLAEELNISINMLYKTIRSLENLGYIKELLVSNRCSKMLGSKLIHISFQPLLDHVDEIKKEEHEREQYLHKRFVMRNALSRLKRKLKKSLVYTNNMDVENFLSILPARYGHLSFDDLQNYVNQAQVLLAKIEEEQAERK